ncbi:MAG: hypothetical protein WKF57_04125 [Nakamurella sp.]
MPNFTVLGPSDVTLRFGDESPGNDDVSVAVQNRTGKSLEAVYTWGELVFLDPRTYEVIGFGGWDLMDRPNETIRAGKTVNIHYLPRFGGDCRATPGSEVPNGHYPAYLRVYSQGAVGVYLIPVSTDITDRKVSVSGPTPSGPGSSTTTQQIAGRTWTLRELKPANGRAIAVADLELSWVKPKLELNPDGSFNLLTGISGRMGTYSVSGSLLSIEANVYSSSLVVKNGSNEAKIAYAMGELLVGATIREDHAGELILRLGNGDELTFG